MVQLWGSNTQNDDKLTLQLFRGSSLISIDLGICSVSDLFKIPELQEPPTRHFILKNVTILKSHAMCISEAGQPAVRSSHGMWLRGPDKGGRDSGRVQTRSSDSREACSRLERLSALADVEDAYGLISLSFFGEMR